MGWIFGLTTKYVYRNVGRPFRVNSNKSKQELGMNYIPFEKTIVDMVDHMETSGVV
jgi:hypothetical protein